MLGDMAAGNKRLAMENKKIKAGTCFMLFVVEALDRRSL